MVTLLIGDDRLVDQCLSVKSFVSLSDFLCALLG